ncbi:GIY-YIG nuclease family protein [Spiroplasma endosymbiont of Cantharis nigra]|uniref:GIY-YIG nuclease family protein n=1 Tax=Spiroplasma endosymbiont of Cantharis nigra TaxID=3066278 RepID=UPI0030D2FBB9
MKNLFFIKTIFNIRNKKAEIAFKKKNFLNLDLSNDNEIANFYSLEQSYKFMKEIGPRGGIKRYTIKESNKINPFIESLEFNKFNNLNEYSSYQIDKRRQASDLDQKLAKENKKGGFILLTSIISFLLIFLFGISLMINLSNDKPMNNFLLVMLPLSFIVSLSFLIWYCLLLNYLRNLFHNFYCNIEIINKETYFNLKYKVLEKNDNSLDIFFNIKRGISFNNIKNGLYQNSNQGIYGIKIINNNQKDTYKIPIYIGQANNIFSRWKQHINSIEKVFYQNRKDLELKYEKIVEYVKHYDLKLENIYFFILEENLSQISWSREELKQLETNWIKDTNSGSRGFNAIR